MANICEKRVMNVTIVPKLTTTLVKFGGDTLLSKERDPILSARNEAKVIMNPTIYCPTPSIQS